MLLVDGTNQKVKVRTSSQVSTSSAETFVVDAGTLGGYAGVFASETSGGFACLYLKTNSNVSNFAFFVRDTTIVGSITTNGSSTSFNTSSDYRAKESITYDFDATTRLKQLKPCRFNFIADADTTVDGFLAHEVSSIVPEAITGNKDETEDIDNLVLNADGSINTSGISQSDWTKGKSDGTYASDTTWVASKTVPKYQSIDQSKLVPLLTKALQEQQATIEALTSRIVTLENA